MMKKTLMDVRVFFTLISISFVMVTTGTVSIDPTTACVGDPVTVSCTLEVPNSATHAFFSILTNFIVGNSDIAITETAVDGAGTHGGVDLSKLMATASGGNTTFVQGTITLLSYTTGDNGTRLGCANEYSINGNTSDRDTVLNTATVIQAAPPLTPNIVVSLSSLSTDCTNALLSWTAPASDRAIERYYAYRDSTLLAVSTDTQYTDTDQLIVNTPYSYSVIANSCAGNSTGGVETVTITGSELSDSPPFFINYTSSDSMLLVDWTLKPNPGAPPLLLQYSLRLEYSHSRESTNYTFSSTTQFSLLSSDVTTRSVAITAHNFTSEDGVQTEVTAYISIAQQCGTPFSGVEQRADYNSSNPPTRPPSTIAPTTTPNGTTPVMSTAITTTTIAPTSGELPITIIAAAVGGGGVVLFILIIILVVIMLCICCGKKSEGSKYPNHRKSGDNVELSAPGHSTDNIHSEEYSQINRSQKSPNTADIYSFVQKQAPPQKELLYADLDIMSSQTGRVHTSVVPHTQYTDLAQLPAADHTLYASVHTDGPS